MSKAAPVEPSKTQEEPEAIPPKPPRTPEEEAAHLLKKAEKQEKEGREAQEAPVEPDRDHSLGLPRVVGQHGVRDVSREPCQ